MNDKLFDFWYAVHHTAVLSLPSKRLETFGSSVVHYHLVSELMDSVDKVRVREGRIEAFRPEIITPRHFTHTELEGFGPEAARYAEWLRDHESELMILKYGFAIRKKEIRDHVVTSRLAAVVEQVQQRLRERNDPLDALVVGVDEPWEVCLVKLMVEVVQKSAPHHARDLRHDPRGKKHDIEQAFAAVGKGRDTLSALSDKLRESGMFEAYQDRFFALVREMKS